MKGRRKYSTYEDLLYALVNLVETVARLPRVNPRKEIAMATKPKAKVPAKKKPATPKKK